MSIWVNEHSRVMVQGITGKAARYHTEQMLAYGTNIVAGVSPSQGEHVLGVPVYSSVREAKKKTQANVSIIYVPAAFAADAIIEAVDAEMPLIICITEHIPVLDMLKVKFYMNNKKSRLIGPNCPGIITPDRCKIGIMPGHIHQKGSVGIVSRSGTLTYEAVHMVSKSGYGQSTAVGIGGDPIHGTNFIDVLKAFNEDEDTEAVIMIGEIGGQAEEDASEWIKSNMQKPVIGFIGGLTAPEGKRMGHAGAIVSGKSGSAEHKIEVMESNGVKVARSLNDIQVLLNEVLS